jgi:hypothetical protein
MPSFSEMPMNKEKKTNEQYRQEYLVAMKGISQDFNKTYEVEFLSDDCTISMKNYGSTPEKLARDYEVIKKKEIKWISEKEVVNPDQVTEEMHQDWLLKQKDVKNKKSDILEMMTTLLLRKGLHKDYVVVRASQYDDYHGVDNIIVHKASGAVICAFDDVHDFNFSEGSNEEKKIKFVKKSAEKGGSTIEHGFTFIEGEFVKKKIENVPKLYMAFTPNELNKALELVNTKNLDSLEENELQFYNKMIIAFESQIKILLESGKKNQKFIENVKKFEELLPSMKQAGLSAGEGSVRLAA